MRVALIGTGAMGEPMAANLLGKGFELRLLRHRSEEPAARLRALGATVCADVADTIADCEAVVLALPGSREVEAVVSGPAGIAAHARPGSVVIDCTTAAPESTKRLGAELAQRGIALVDAGMTRGVAGAKQGTLAFFLGGEERHIEQALPVLRALGDTFVRVGPLGHGHTAKLISNVLSYATVALVNEAFMLGARSGLDLGRLHEALAEGAPSKALEAFGPRIRKGEYEPPRVTVEHVCDDMVMLQALVAQTGSSVAMLATAQELYRLLQMQGGGSRDMSTIAELWRTAAGAH
jgi:3-hydroxyisobutyrate dehydrogenase-like beta-hydroxyacid dehydrogenase